MEDLSGLLSDCDEALPDLTRAAPEDCTFRGTYALAGGRELTLLRCLFSGRFPLPHLADSLIRECTFDAACHEALWYGVCVTLQDCVFSGARGLRGCDTVTVDRMKVFSDDFGWKCREIVLRDSSLSGGQLFLDAQALTGENVEISGARALQYLTDAHLDFSTLQGSDCLWHAENVTVTDSVLEGDRLGWYSNGLTLRGCVISGARPFAHCRGLTLEDCKLEDTCIFAFENSEVHATLRGHLPSVRNPLRGEIVADTVGEILRDARLPEEADCRVRIRGG